MSDEVLYPIELAGSSEEPPDSSSAVEHTIEGKSFGIRALSYLIDMAVILAVNYGVGFVVGILFGIVLLVAGRPIPEVTESTQWWCLDYIVSALMTLAYFTLFEGLFGATAGKLITGMRVIKQDGSPCDLRAAFHRGVWRFVDAIIFGAIAYTNIEPPRQQRLGDKKAKTLVVSKASPFIQQQKGLTWFLLAGIAYLVVEAVNISIILAAMIF